MKKIYIAVLIALCLTFKASAQTTAAAEQSPELKEAGDLSAQVVRLYGEKKYDEALPLAKRALKIREDKLGASNPLVASALTNLAELYLAKEKPGDAEPLYQRALSIYEKAQAAPDPRVGQILDRLALIRFAKEDYGKAEELFQRAIFVKEKALSPDSEELVQSLNNLADLYNVKHEFVKAESLLQRVISIREKSTAGASPELGLSLQRMACVMYRNKEDAEAQKVEARANDILYKGKPEPVALPLDFFSCKIVKNPYPKFPTSARRFSGVRIILVNVDVDETGKVTSAKMISGEQDFRDASEKAALNAQLRPTIVDGRPVKVTGIIKYQFMTKVSTMVVGPVPAPGGRP